MRVLGALLLVMTALSVSAVQAAGKKPAVDTSCAQPPAVLRVLPIEGKREIILPDGQAHDLDTEFMQQLLGQLTQVSAQERVIQVMTEARPSAEARSFMAEEVPPDYWWEASLLPSSDLIVTIDTVEWKKGVNIHWSVPLFGHLIYEKTTLRLGGEIQLNQKRIRFSVVRSGTVFEVGAYIPTQAGAFEVVLGVKRKGLMVRAIQGALGVVAANVRAEARRSPSLLRVDQVVNGELLMGGTTGLTPAQLCGWVGKTVSQFGDGSSEMPSRLKVSRATISGVVAAVNPVQKIDFATLPGLQGSIWIWTP